MNNSKDNLIIKSLENIINKMNYIIKENKKNIELIRNYISSLYNSINKRFDYLEINSKNQEILFVDSKYIGQTMNIEANWKGILYGFNGNILM